MNHVRYRIGRSRLNLTCLFIICIKRLMCDTSSSLTQNYWSLCMNPELPNTQQEYQPFNSDSFFTQCVWCDRMCGSCWVLHRFVKIRLRTWLFVVTGFPCLPLSEPRMGFHAYPLSEPRTTFHAYRGSVVKTELGLWATSQPVSTASLQRMLSHVTF